MRQATLRSTLEALHEKGRGFSSRRLYEQNNPTTPSDTPVDYFLLCLTCEKSMSSRVVRHWRREEQAQRAPEASVHHGFEERARKVREPLLNCIDL